MNSKYGFGKIVPYSFKVALEKVKKELAKEGFGILTEIDVAATLKKNLDQEMAPYIILGACNAPLAHRALELDSSIGLLMPCNVVVRLDNKNNVHVEFMDPSTVLELVNELTICPIAEEITHRLKRVMGAL